jgi:hypothetical protein
MIHRKTPTNDVDVRDITIKSHLSQPSMITHGFSAALAGGAQRSLNKSRGEVENSRPERARSGMQQDCLVMGKDLPRLRTSYRKVGASIPWQCGNATMFSRFLRCITGFSATQDWALHRLARFCTMTASRMAYDDPSLLTSTTVGRCWLQ